MTFGADPSIPAAAGAAPGMHACPQCPKSFARHCDLNKHAKSHTRPYKCKEPGCKYNTRGWPTAKELERHYNDKHSATPRTFRCLFEPCTYWSKRESNCKQHMEKAHNWEYVRSKSKGKRTTAQAKEAVDEDAADEDAAESNDDGMPAGGNNSPSAEPAFMNSHQFRSGDFVLYDGDDQADAIGEDDSLYSCYPEPQMADAYLPWTSPVTRLKKTEYFIERFSQTYKGIQDDRDTPMSGCSSDLDSGLSPYGFPGTQQYPQPAAPTHHAHGSMIKVESPVLTLDSVFPGNSKFEPVDGALFEPKQDPGLVSPGGASHPSKAHGTCKRGDSNSDDGCIPTKKQRPNPVENFTDTSMPDIFRFAHPEIYDKSRKDRYSPCHTVHREISTLVRHLSRPAHRLKVTERYISSFDIEDPDFQHPRAGVCRTCWQSFDNRSAFETHVAAPCPKVSKGKREKWRVLFESFTSLRDSTDDASHGADAVQNLAETEMELCEPDHHLPETAKIPPISVPASTASSGTALGPSPNDGAVHIVPASELARIQREHQALRQRNQQLERMAKALLIQRLYRENLRAPAASSPGVRTPTSSTKDCQLGTAIPALSDRDNLLQHMDSQSTDVDVHAFMAEFADARQVLNGTQLGPTATGPSQSAIHRVPPSPPTQLANYPDAGSNQANNWQSKAQPLPSIADSGYGTEQRRASLATIQVINPEDAAVVPAGPLTQPSTAGATEQKGVDEADSSLAHGGCYTSTNTSQPGFLTDQDMADYADPSYNIFYQDHVLQSRPPPLGFTFECSSQTD
ncbi:hypothetical protein VTJ49DRAFT_798 [Mycothermus thermophilus]|uniref:C2H2-type domain-containing protein n=1 Tax=Humicola insolens TaxID=85995 RepID=A0ABR3VEI3_HUMIN